MQVDKTIVWTSQLKQDYLQICYTYRVNLECPWIRIIESQGFWGKWDPETRTITIARRLIENHPWSVVIEILKHEMAHQLVSEEYGSDESHGPLFHTACAQLGVTDWARRAEVELNESFFKNHPTPGDEKKERLLNRVEKLLSLAGSPNEHEARAAVKKVHELYQKYRIDRLTSGGKSEFTFKVIETNKKRLERHHQGICSLLVDHFSVEVIQTHLFSAESLTKYQAIEIFGSSENTLMAEYVYHFLENQMNLLWKAHKNRKGIRGRNGFFLGVISGFREQLSSQKEVKSDAQNSPLLPELIRQDNQLLKSFISFRHPRIVRTRSAARSYDRDSFLSGQEKGKRLILRKGLEKKSSKSRIFLPTSK